MSDDGPDSILGSQHVSNGARRNQHTGVAPDVVIASWGIVAFIAFLIGLFVGVLL
jgi:hypothetical protein